MSSEKIVVALVGHGFLPHFFDVLFLIKPFEFLFLFGVVAEFDGEGCLCAVLG